MSREQWTLPYGTAACDGWDVDVTPDGRDWRHTALRVATLAAGQAREVAADDFEHIVVPLRGAVHVTAVTGDGRTHEAALAGRPGVFAGPTDVAYAPRGTRVTVRAARATAVVAVAGARAAGRGAETGGVRGFRHVAAADVPVEQRGSGAASREVRNFGTPDVLDAEAIIACEVVTPAGNWSSWPPHKHDHARPGAESALEEIYCFATASADPRCTDPVGYQRVYAATPRRPIDVLAEVRTGDVVLVPHGWHGPSIAAPDAHLYYLNVMAGPGPERAWLISDDPAHAAVRASWPAQPFDPRLPLPADTPTTPPGARPAAPTPHGGAA